jgi:hypothetical protein
LAKRRRTGKDLAIGEGSSSVALTDLMEAMDHLIKVQTFYHFTKATEEATKLIIADSSLSEEQRAILCIYYGKNIPEAADLPFMDASLRNLVFKNVLRTCSL